MKKGFTLIEILIVIAIIAILSAIILPSLLGARDSARDARRKSELVHIGRFVTAKCYTPDTGAGDYDFADVAAELRTKYPQYASQLRAVPQDPSTGSETETKYRYIVASNGSCALYANLERDIENITLTGITTPTPGGGTGVFQAATAGWNGSNKYYQISN